jgi:hypothetical protein
MDQQTTTPTQEQTAQQPVTPVQETPAQVAPIQPVSTPAVGQTPPVTTSPIQPVMPPVSPAAEGNKKQLIVATGVIVVALFLLGSMFYIMGVVNRTKRLSAIKASPTAVQQVKQQPQKAEQSSFSEEEQSAASVDTGDPTTDITGLNKDLSTFGN